MRFPRRSIYIGALLCLLVASGASLIYELLRMHESEQLREQSAERSSALHVNLESFFREQTDALGVMMALYRDNRIGSQADFTYYAGQIFALVPGLRSISASDPDYALVYQFPRINLSHNLTVFKDRLPYANLARDDHLITTTAPLHLATDGRLGFAMYVPVYSASKFRGLIIGTFEVDQLVDRQLKPILKDASFLLRTEDGTVFYKSGELANNPANLYSTTIRVAQTSWTVSWDQHEPSPEYLRYGRAIELVATVLLAALVLLILYLFQTSKIDTQQHTLQVFEQNCLRIEQQFNEKQQENAVLYRQLESTQGDLIRATKMATLGEMAAVLAHEIRNPLTAIINCLETLKRSNRNSENTTLFDMSMKEALRLEHIVSDCLNFARPKRPEIENVNLGAIVSEVVHAFRQDSRWRSRARVNFVDFEHDVTVRSDPEQLGQVLWNLLINSAQAIPKSGDIAIECFLDAEGTQASVQIRDSGEGMAPDTQARIFEPFFSTKHAGVGLGLFIVKRIIDDHDGSITVDSAVGRGTVVTIWLPVVKEIMHVALAGHR